jgi:hypothetical protein
MKGEGGGGEKEKRAGSRRSVEMRAQGTTSARGESGWIDE